MGVPGKSKGVTSGEGGGGLSQRAHWDIVRSQWKTLSHKVGNLVYVCKGPSECRLRRTRERQGGRETS